MPLEIERKFLVIPEKLPAVNPGVEILQAYIPLQTDDVVRIRIKGDQAYVTFKGKDRQGVRPEYEYSIPVHDAREIIEIMCARPVIRKVRTAIWYEGYKWEIDSFLDENEGLIIAEIELKYADEIITLPPWVAEEVTGDPRYLNASLVKHPFNSWQ